jgi:hypothetical protein
MQVTSRTSRSRSRLTLPTRYKVSKRSIAVQPCSALGERRVPSSSVIGKNISLHIKLTRTGNGSEYPAYLDLAHTLARNVTWAYRFVSSAEEYAALTSGDRDVLRFSKRSRRHLSPGRMLMMTGQRELEEQRDLKEAHRELGVGGVSYTSGRGGRWRLGDHQARYDFEENGDEYGDVYEFDVELPM